MEKQYKVIVRTKRNQEGVLWLYGTEQTIRERITTMEPESYIVSIRETNFGTRISF